VACEQASFRHPCEAPRPLHHARQIDNDYRDCKIPRLSHPIRHLFNSISVGFRSLPVCVENSTLPLPVPSVASYNNTSNSDPFRTGPPFILSIAITAIAITLPTLSVCLESQPGDHMYRTPGLYTISTCNRITRSVVTISRSTTVPTFRRRQLLQTRDTSV
jgi:hypothetical protein